MSVDTLHLRWRAGADPGAPDAIHLIEAAAEIDRLRTDLAAVSEREAKWREALREDHAGCDGLRRAGLRPHPCRVCDLLAEEGKP